MLLQELCRELGISSARFHKLLAKFGGMETSMMSRMKEAFYFSQQRKTGEYPLKALVKKL